jgi:hypothetical protein
MALSCGSMATRTIVQLEDDLSGGEADESLTFGIDGKHFEIDLSEANAERLRELLAPYIAAGRSVRVTRGGRPGAADIDPATVRAWAHDQGYAVSSRGRVSKELREAYANAHG